MVKKTKKLIIMASGTGGHIFPGLTVAHYLMKEGWSIHWLGATNHMETHLVSKHGIHMDLIDINGLRGKKFKKQLLSLVSLCRAFSQSYKIMRTWKPDVVLGMGGYISGPGGLAAWSCGIPVVLHEQNRVAGITNRYLAKVAHTVLQAFPGAFSYAEVVGNPVRDEILYLPEPSIRFLNRSGPIRVLILGGSQGASLLNKIMPKVAIRLDGKLIMWHQAGKGSAKKVNHMYSMSKKIKHKVVEFIDDIATAYSWADIIICRSGALTVSEIISAGLPALFVPFRHKDRHQYWNAKPLENTGAAKIIEEHSFSEKTISDLLASWDRPKLLNMAKCAKSVMITPCSTELVAKSISAAVRL